MVAPTPTKPFFEGNNASNAPALFFEFAFETSIKLPSSSDNSRRKKLFYAASRLVLTILIIGLVLGSGILRNDFFIGKSATQAAMAWIPSWPENISSEVNKADIVSIRNFEDVQPSEIAHNPAEIGASIETMNPLNSEKFTLKPASNENLSASSPIPVEKPISDLADEKAPIPIKEVEELVPTTKDVKAEADLSIN